MKKLFLSLTVAFFSLWSFAAPPTSGKGETITLVLPQGSHARLQFGAQKLTDALVKAGYTVKKEQRGEAPRKGSFIVIARQEDELWKKASGAARLSFTTAPKKEGFSLAVQNKAAFIGGADESGTLYGCLELADRITEKGRLPQNLSLTDAPEMVLRGACVGVQKPTLLPGRGVYEYPITPETFPWLYDKALWTRYLDSLVANRMNSLYLWNGHPFASLVRLPDYPYAVEVDSATFARNEEIYRFLTTEADKRGIWVIQAFYNIIISKPFADKHGLKTQDRNRPIVPVIADYTRKSIAAFVEKYPNVGLLITLGEAMEGVGEDDVNWFTQTILPGVKDGLKALGRTNEPPVVLRAHDTDAPRVMAASKPIYTNLYTMAKYNGEALTTYTPRGKWAELHRTLSSIGTVHVQNVHILANLEPFRYGSADFIQKSVKAMHDVYGSNGLHLYPQASYWDWPYTADRKSDRQLQLERDWIWYKAWARYAWNCRRDRSSEVAYWGNQLGTKFGAGSKGGQSILEAYEQTGEIAPKLLRRYGITDGNRQTLTLGMLMGQLINPFKYGLFTLLYESEAPEGEMIIEYAEKEWKGQQHVGETPVQVADEVVAHGRKAIEAIEAAAPLVTTDRQEFMRLKNDVYCYDELANHYADKVRAGLQILRYKYSNDIADLEKAVPLLEKSVAHYRKLTALTSRSYLYANSMQTSMRKIPLRGVDGTYKEWHEVLPVFEQELHNLKKNIDSLKHVKPNTAAAAVAALKNVPVTLVSGGEGSYTLAKGASLFSDTTVLVDTFAAELKGLKGIQFSKKKQLETGTTLQFKAAKPVKLVVGYFNPKTAAFQKNTDYAKAPELETDATANEYGQDEVKIANALVAGDLPRLNIHTYSFKAGTHTLTLPKGQILVLGFTEPGQPLKAYDAGLGAPAQKEMDWLLE
ncbi:hypothetical protein V9K67_01950 [Paraflavisolibacter sp. H34]|uniref:alpha-d-galacturonidase n=1 Tax=Huijunlia imazamoxiresistens TaxID=3127457 RepID=UPI003016A378